MIPMASVPTSEEPFSSFQTINYIINQRLQKNVRFRSTSGHQLMGRVREEDALFAEHSHFHACRQCTPFVHGEWREVDRTQGIKHHDIELCFCYRGSCEEKGLRVGTNTVTLQDLRYFTQESTLRGIKHRWWRSAEQQHSCTRRATARLSLMMHTSKSPVCDP